MESSLRDRCGPAARALMLSAFLALAWLVWGAGTADAAPSGPGSGPGAGPIKEVPLPVAPPAQAAAALARTAVVVLNQAPATVATVAATAAPVLNSAAPVLNPAADVIDQASGALPVPLPVPPAVLARVPLAATTGKEALPATAPTTRPATPQDAAPDAAQPKQATAGTGQRTAGPGDTAAPLPVDAAAVRALPAVDEYLAPSSPPDAPQDPEKLLWLSALQGPAGSSSSGPGTGPGGGGAQAAGDAAGFWNHLAARRSAPAPDMAQAPAAGPSFDPGSSPD